MHFGNLFSISVLWDFLLIYVVEVVKITKTYTHYKILGSNSEEDVQPNNFDIVSWGGWTIF